MKKRSAFSVRGITLIGVLAACVFVLTKFISIPIPSPLGKTALSLGNAMCILSSLLFGPVIGGLASGLGNALVDLTDPAWAHEFYITFINKFLMAYVAGVVMQHFKLGSEKLRVCLAGLCGAVTYTVLYIVKNIIFGLLRGFTWQVAVIETLTTKLPVSLVNGVLAVVCATILFFALRRPLQKAHIIE